MFKLKENFVNDFLWSCAGVNKEILRLYPSEYAKYAGSGGTILFTALMAMISGGYAMYFVFNSVIAVCIFSLFWGLLIFNLDRFIVNSMHTDGKDTLSLKKLKAAFPRIIMAIFLGIVISTPLEMKIFNDRIESLLLKDNLERINEAKSQSTDYVTLLQLQTEQQLLSNERKTLADELQKALKELKEEAEGNALSGQAGHGAIYKDKEKYVESCTIALSEWDILHKTRLNNILVRIDEINKHIELFETKIDNLKEDGFSARYEAFANLKNSNNSLNTVSMMITILFIIIEITPTFFKLIMTSGPYDEHKQIDDYKVYAVAKQLKDNIDTELKISEYDNKKKIEEYTSDEIILDIQQEQEDEILYSTIKPVTTTVKRQNTITYEEPEEVPYNIKSNTSITTVPKKQKTLDYSKNQYGLLVLNFSNKNRY